MSLINTIDTTDDNFDILWTNIQIWGRSPDKHKNLQIGWELAIMDDNFAASQLK